MDELGERYAKSILDKRFYQCLEREAHIYYHPPSDLVCPRCGIRRDFPAFVNV